MEQPIRKKYTDEYVKGVIQELKVKSLAIESASNNIIKEKMKVKELQKLLSLAESKLKQKAVEKSAETRKENGKYQIEWDQIKFKNQQLVCHVMELEEQLKKAMKRGLKKPSP